MNAVLEALQERQPRIPLPAAANGNYLPETWGAGGLGGFTQVGMHGARDRSGGIPDPRLDDLFTDPGFWVVSRANNCHYCLGHQELKLRAAGLSDDAIAALDSDWSLFNPRQQAALDFARKLTLEPQLIEDKDIARLKAVFSDSEILELTFNIARFNAVNRWTDAMGFPQEQHEGKGNSKLAASRTDGFQHTASLVTPDTRAPRPPVPAWDDVLQAIESCRGRSARIALPSAEAAARVLAGAIGDRKPLQWERAVAGLAGPAAMQVATFNNIMTDERLGMRLKAELSLITAINNGAWYAAGHAIDSLRRLKASNEELAAFMAANAAAAGAAPAHRLAANLTADPHLITDADIARVRERFGDAQTAQIVHVISMANMFDRFTSALGLPLD